MPHHALEIPEILLMIFKHVFRPPQLQTFPDIQHNSDMVALARTCRAFREPALDVLWSSLSSLSPLVRCIPRAIYAEPFFQQNTQFMFYRALTEDEWRVLRSYTSRVRVIKRFDLGLAVDPIPENLFGQELLFPNLRELNLVVSYNGISPWLRQQYIPSLDSIKICSPALGQPSFLRDCVAQLSEFYPNLTKITVKGCGIGIFPNPARSVDSWPWKDLQVLDCPDSKLETEDLKTLSRLPSLVKLTFALSNAEDIIAALSSEHSVLVFRSLKDLKFSCYCPSLELTSSFLAQVSLPAVEQLVAHVNSSLTKDIGPFLSAVQGACEDRPNGPVNILQSIRLTDVGLLQMAQVWDSDRIVLRQPQMQMLRNWASQRNLTLVDLLPSMAFTNIRHLELDIVAHIHITDDALLHLVSAWPFLERLSINETTGWNHPLSADGWITLDGLQQILLKCPLLNHIGLVVRAPNSATEAAALNQSMSITNLNSRGKFYINVMDSVIEELAIPVIASFLARVVGPHGEFKLKAWSAFSCRLYSDRMETENRARWNKVRSGVKEILGRSEGSKMAQFRTFNRASGICT